MNPTDPPPSEEPRPTRWATLPNLLCATRFVGSFVLVGVALTGSSRAFIGLFIFLALTDWFDGKLAILLNQRSKIGPWLDSLADIAMYTALLFGLCWLQGERIREESLWVAAALGTFFLEKGWGVLRFGQWPTYHTRLAKTCWFLGGLGAIVLLAKGPVWPFQFAMAMVTLANLEAILITWVLPAPETDLPSLYHALRKRKTDTD